MNLSSATGDNSISVVIDGHRNNVTIQHASAKLVLNQRHKVRGIWISEETEHSELDLLLTEHRAIDLVGRDEELTQLHDWLRSKKPISFWCVCGRGGAGKTRLGIELCERAESSGWDAGFVSDTELKRFHGAQNLGDWRWKNPTLVIVDYAAASLEAVRDWLAELASLNPSARQAPLRLLLLEREADAGSGWWGRLLGDAGLSAKGPGHLVAATKPLQLRPIGEASDCRAILGQVINLAARLLGKEAPTLPSRGSNSAFDAQLEGGGPDKEPLYLAMAGLVAVREGFAAALSLDRGALAKYVAHGERRRLERLATSWGFKDEPSVITHLAACVTLQGGCDADTLLILVSEERRHIGDKFPMSDETLAHRIHEALRMAEGGRADAIRPDLIGEAFILAELGMRSSEDAQTEIVRRAWIRDSRSVVSTLVRIAQDFAGLQPDHCSLRWLASLATKIGKLEDLVEITQALPEHTVALRSFSCSMQNILVRACRKIYARDPAKGSYLAGELNNYSARLSALGQAREALIAAQEAVDVYRKTGRLTGHGRTRGLATSLTSVGNQLFISRDYVPALTAVREAVDICRELLNSGEESIVDLLALSLNSMGNILSVRDRHEEALETSRETVALYRELSPGRPDVRPDLAGSLVNFAARLGNLSHWGEATSAIEEALLIYREFAFVHPDAYRSGLALALFNYGRILQGTGDCKAAVEVTREAAGYYQELSAIHPAAFLADYAHSLSVTADYLENLGRVEESLRHDEQAIAVLSRQFQISMTAFKPVLAGIAGDHFRRAMRHGRMPSEAAVAEVRRLLDLPEDADGEEAELDEH